MCRSSIASLGYVDDPFAHELHPRSERRPPLINRGGGARGVQWPASFAPLNPSARRILRPRSGCGYGDPAILGVQQCATTNHQLGGRKGHHFLQAAGVPARPSCGAVPGADGPPQARGVALAAYVEVDFPEVVREKVMTIRRRSKLRSALGEPTDRALAEAYGALHANAQCIAHAATAVAAAHSSTRRCSNAASGRLAHGWGGHARCGAFGGKAGSVWRGLEVRARFAAHTAAC